MAALDTPKIECFKLISYPEWWPDAKKKGTKVATRSTDGGRTYRAAMGLSVDDEAASEPKIDLGVALIRVSGNHKESHSFSNGTSQGGSFGV